MHARALSFEDAWAHARRAEGWLTEAQARRLYEAAAGIRADGRIVEIGSFRARSAIVLAAAAPAGAEVVCIDPHLGSDRGPNEIAARPDVGAEDHEAFLANLERAGVAGRVRHVRARSQEALGAVRGPVELLWVDGAHRFGPARDDLVRWGARVPEGGRMLVHDAFSSVGVTLALLSAVTFSRRWRYEGRVGSLASYVHVPGGGGTAPRQLAQLGWFARNLVVKALIVARLRRGPWPY